MLRASVVVLGLIGLVGPACVSPPPATIAQNRPQEPESPDVVVSGDEGVEVLAEGVAAVEGSVAVARDQALKDALRKAVEQGVGTFLSAESRVQNFQLISDRIYSQASGYVSSYKVIAEGMRTINAPWMDPAKANTYRVTVRAKVKLDRIEDDLAAIGLLVQEQGRPRIMVLVRGGAEDDGATAVTTRIMARLQEKGFPVVDQATMEKNLEREQLKKILEGDNQAALLAGMRSGAEIVLAGVLERSVSRKVVPWTQNEADFYRVRLSCRAISVQSAEVLGATVVNRELPFSEEQALEQAADSVSAELMSRILAGWKRRMNVTQVYAANADYAKVERLKAEILHSVRGVLSVITRELAGSDAVIEIVSETSTQEIYQELGSGRLATKFAVTGIAGNRIDIRFRE
ncbi:MAG: hypothetical protein ABIK44_07815 [candidate division WOR-3 bacterium]